jgi:Xaa-Pro aminopeptidase
MFRSGADDVGYETIVAAGSHAAVLHSRPSQTLVADDDVVLIDAGGAIAGYTADVTRTFPAGSRFTSEQQAIYDIVLAAELAAINRCRDGVEWHDVHRACAAELAAGLRHLGILKIGVEESLESEAIALFFPHGIGHMVGLGVRDVGGRAPGREENRLCCGAKVRVDLPIRSGFVMTIEPGIYFVPAILDDAERRAKFPNALAWEKLSRWRNVGGVRIEDNVEVTESEPKVITGGIPK